MNADSCGGWLRWLAAQVAKADDSEFLSQWNYETDCEPHPKTTFHRTEQRTQSNAHTHASWVDDDWGSLNREKRRLKS